MSDSPRNTRSLVIGTLLALLSAGCLVAFALLAGSTDYPSGPPIAAIEPNTSAPAVKLTDRSKRNSDRPEVRPGRENDPTAPIVLGIQVTQPEPRDESRERDRNRDNRKNRNDDRDSKGSKGSRKPSKGSDDKQPDDTEGSPPQVAKPTTDSPEWDEDGKYRRGHAYGRDKKEDDSTSKGNSPSSKGGPPAHAQANGHDKDSSSASDASSGPPDHAQANGHSDSSSKESSSSPGNSSGNENSSSHASPSSNGDSSSPGNSSKGGPPGHAQANGHAKKSKG
jgi:hypothetical protein